MPVDFVALIGRIENVWLAYGWIVAKLRAESSEFSVGNMRYTTYRIVQHEDYWRIIQKKVRRILLGRLRGNMNLTANKMADKSG